MPRVQWSLRNDRPSIEVVLTQVQGGLQVTRRLVADTGAGTAKAGFELLLEEQDCLVCGGISSKRVVLSGAFSGPFPVYSIQVRIPALGFDHKVFAVGVPIVPRGFDGIACFRFLNRFTYGNFADQGKFGLEF